MDKRVVVSIELELDLNNKVESKFLKIKMDGLKKGRLKISKRNFYAYLLTKGMAAFDQTELEDFLTKAEDK